MTFNSLPFLGVFLPLMLGIYYLLPKAARNGALLLGSLLFYALGTRDRLWNLGLLLALIPLTYGLGLALGKVRRKAGLLAAGLVFLFGLLAGFKAAGLLGTGLALPLGMSFYTFQMAGYLIDIFRGTPPEPRFLRYAGEILFFPKLLSGPLTPYRELGPQMENRPYRVVHFDLGLREFIRGLAMKVLLADQLGGLWRQVRTLGFESVSTVLAWMGILAYSLQLYFDFCGYSEMARGLGRMLGFRLPQNFDHPYAARTMTAFWRRWHISLGAWFRDYVYIPLGGSRKGRARTALNLLVVWVLTGLWHGGTFNYLLWALFLYLLILGEKFLWGRALERRPLLGHLYMALAIPLSWLPFAIGDSRKLLLYLGRLFPLTGQFGGLKAWDFLAYGKRYGPLLLLGFFFAMPWEERLRQRFSRSALDTLFCILLFWAAVYCLSMSTGDPFLYFTF